MNVAGCAGPLMMRPTFALLFSATQITLSGPGNRRKPGQEAYGDGLAGPVLGRPFGDGPGGRPVFDQARHGQTGIQNDGVLRVDRDALLAVYAYRS
jgi:hypothetical protein